MDELIYENWFPTRLTQLRMKKDVSARDMSLSIGQNPGYINNIESGKSLPSMAGFFLICEFLKITPKDFFDVEAEEPLKIDTLTKDLKKLNSKQLDCIAFIVKELIK